MSIGIIELNDAGIRVATRDDSNIVAESPGVAVVTKNELLLGDDALHQSRLQPVQTNSLFWHRLNAEPIALLNSRYRHHADLAYSHLLTLHQTIAACDEIIFALPGSFSRQQMSLLLGIVGQCPFNAVGLVDSAVAASAPYAGSGPLMHVDLQLHQCVFTQMQVDDQVRRTRVEVLPHCGLFGLRDQWAKAIADQFIDQSRFDPLHSAATEQSLYDQLPDWLGRYRDNTELFLEVSGKSIKLTREQLISTVEPYYRQIASKARQLMDTDSELLLGDRLAELPGLVDVFDLDAVGTRARPLNSSAVMEGVRKNVEAIKTGADQLAFVQVLPRTTDKSAEAGPAQPENSARPPIDRGKPRSATHLLVGNRAYPIGDSIWYLDVKQQRIGSDETAVNAQCAIRRRGSDIALVPHAGANIKVNDQPVSDNCFLQGGDRITAAGSTASPIVLIEVVENEAAKVKAADER